VHLVFVYHLGPYPRRAGQVEVTWIGVAASSELTLGCGVGTGAGLKKSAAARKKPSAVVKEAAGFKVVDGTVVADRAHTAVDADVAADVERELGNEAFRDQVSRLALRERV
jgi:hypothetical protein